jgi:hypothetical protein
LTLVLTLNPLLLFDFFILPFVLVFVVFLLCP